MGHEVDARAGICSKLPLGRNHVIKWDCFDERSDMTIQAEIAMLDWGIR